MNDEFRIPPDPELQWLLKLAAIVILFGFCSHTLIKCGTAMLPFAYITLGLSLGIVFSDVLSRILNRKPKS